MNDFTLWFTTGLEHILSLDGFDHILFITLLTVTFPIKNWKKLLILVTSFTVGHSISLALSSFNVLKLNQNLVEFLIAFSILVTALFHIAHLKKEPNSKISFMYIVAVLFGFVHGMGFSYLLKSMLSKTETLIFPLLYFNLGLEIGQIIIVIGVVLVTMLVGFIFKMPFKVFKISNVLIIGIISLYLSLVRFFELFS